MTPITELFSRSSTSSKDETGYTLTPSTTAASAALDAGRIRLEMFFSRAITAMGKTPGTGRTLPVSPSSPTSRYWPRSVTRSAPYAPRIPIAMGRSNPEPSFLRSAGARLMVIWVGGIVYPGVLDGGADAIAALPHRGVGQSDGVEVVFV